MMKISLKILMLLTSIYISLPIIIFLYCWTNFWIGASMTGAMIYLLWAQLRKMKREFFFISTKSTVIISGVLFVWTLVSGAGHRGIFNGDYYKHNAIFNDLISMSWPVRYNLKEIGDSIYLVYYFAYYLPSAVIGKWLGWQAGNGALFIWTFIGIVLVFMWLFSFVSEKKHMWYGLLFPLFSGIDVLGKLLMGLKVVNSEWEWWGRNWQYSGNTTLFFYVPHQALIGWLLMGMVMYMVTKYKVLPLQLLLLTFSLLWSPFIFIGILPFYPLLFIKKQYSLTSLEIIISAIVFFIELLFLISNMTFFIKDTAANGWLWEIEHLFGSWVLVRLSLFYLLEFGLFAVIIYHLIFQRKKRIEFMVFIISLILLCIIPWYKMGLMNDFAMRSTIPALYIIAYFWIRALIEVKKAPIIRAFVVVIFTISSLYPLILFLYGFTHFSFSAPQYTLANLETLKIRRQYLGFSNSIFFTLFHTNN